MTSRFVFTASLIFTFLALRGWPVDGTAWIRALCALAFLMLGLGAMILLPTPTGTRRFKSSGRRRGRDRVAGVLFMFGICGLVYAAMVFAPPAASQFSQQVIMQVMEKLSGQGADDDADSDLPDTQQKPQDDAYEVGAMFDPNGALVPKSANLNPSNEPSISLKLANGTDAQRLRQAGQMYVHLFSHHVFDGERWTSDPGDGPLYLSCDSDGRVHLAQSREAPDYEYTLLHHQLSTGLDALPTLQGVRYVQLPEITQLNQGTWLLPPPDNPLGIIRPYQGASSPREFQNLLARGLPVIPGERGAMHMAPSKDENLNRRIRELAETFRRQGSLDQQIAALQIWLSESFGYTQQMDYPDKDRSAMESFLDANESREGFCVHFATAAALILRELGVPSRVSYGWTGGEHYPEHHQFVFRAEDGHAWAEMYLKDHGWVVFETTPSSGVPPAYAAVPGTEPPEVEAFDEDEKRSRSVQQHGILSWVWVLLLLGGGTAFLLVLAKRRFAEEGTDFDTEGSAKRPAYLQLFYRACARRGHPKPAGCTLPRFLRRLRDEGLAIPFADELLSYHYQIAYREGERDPEAEKQLRRQIKAL